MATEGFRKARVRQSLLDTILHTDPLMCLSTLKVEFQTNVCQSFNCWRPYSPDVEINVQKFKSNLVTWQAVDVEIYTEDLA